jgi:hypothetical protein
MTTALILELPKSRSVIRLEVRHSGGKAVATFRKCYRAGNDLKPTRKAIAFPIPLGALPTLHRAFEGCRRGEGVGKGFRRS